MTYKGIHITIVTNMTMGWNWYVCESITGNKRFATFLPLQLLIEEKVSNDNKTK